VSNASSSRRSVNSDFTKVGSIVSVVCFFIKRIYLRIICEAIIHDSRVTTSSALVAVVPSSLMVFVMVWLIVSVGAIADII
jgi:hypothetical protein